MPILSYFILGLWNKVPLLRLFVPLADILIYVDGDYFPRRLDCFDFREFVLNPYNFPADKHIFGLSDEPDYLCTGLMIVRNKPASLNFMEDWWNIVPKYSGAPNRRNLTQYPNPLCFAERHDQGCIEFVFDLPAYKGFAHVITRGLLTNHHWGDAQDSPFCNVSNSKISRVQPLIHLAGFDAGFYGTVMERTLGLMLNGTFLPGIYGIRRSDNVLFPYEWS